MPGRDDEWYEKTRRRYRSQPRLFAQEYPATALEAFLKSGNTVYDLEVLRDEHDWEAPAWRYDLAMFQATDPEFSLIDKSMAGEYPLEMWVWHKPHVDRAEDGRPRRLPNYVAAADVAVAVHAITDGRDVPPKSAAGSGGALLRPADSGEWHWNEISGPSFCPILPFCPWCVRRIPEYRIPVSCECCPWS